MIFLIGSLALSGPRAVAASVGKTFEFAVFGITAEMSSEAVDRTGIAFVCTTNSRSPVPVGVRYSLAFASS